MVRVWFLGISLMERGLGFVTPAIRMIQRDELSALLNLYKYLHDGDLAPPEEKVFGLKSMTIRICTFLSLTSMEPL